MPLSSEGLFILSPAHKVTKFLLIKPRPKENYAALFGFEIKMGSTVSDPAHFLLSDYLSGNVLDRTFCLYYPA